MTKVPWAVRALPSMAYRAWFTPPPLGRRAAASDHEALGHVLSISIARPGGGELGGFEIGEGPLVLAVHGWGGRAAQMVPLARRLAADGFRVVSIDLPGSAGDSPTDVGQVAQAIRHVIDEIGRPQAVVAHSFGALASRLAIGDASPPRVVLLAPALKVGDILEVFADRARLLRWTEAALRRRLWAWGGGFIPQFEAGYTEMFPDADLMIFHDPADRDTPFVRSAELAALRPRITLVPAIDAGHHGLLADPDVHSAVSAFLAHEEATSLVPHLG